MNEVKEMSLTITFHVWEPFKKETLMELDNLLADLRTKKVLAHSGNLKSLVREHDSNVGPKV